MIKNNSKNHNSLLFIAILSILSLSVLSGCRGDISTQTPNQTERAQGSTVGNTQTADPVSEPISQPTFTPTTATPTVEKTSNPEPTNTETPITSTPKTTDTPIEPPTENTTQTSSPASLPEPIQITTITASNIAGAGGSVAGAGGSVAGAGGSVAGAGGSVAGAGGSVAGAGGSVASTFRFSAPSTIEITQGTSSAGSNLTLNRTNFSSAVIFSLQGAPLGVSATFSPASTTGNSSVITISASSVVAAGTYNVNIRATSTTLTQNSPLLLTIKAASSGGSAGAAGSSVRMELSLTTPSLTSINQDRYNMDLDHTVLTKIYLNPNGRDTNDGLSPTTPIRYLNTAGSLIRSRERCIKDTPCVMSTTGYQIILAPGIYPDEQKSHIMDYIQGTATYPIIITSSTGNRNDVVVKTSLEFDRNSYIYLYDFSIHVPSDILHFSHSHHMLVRNMSLDGRGGAHDMFKINQAQYIYLEDSELQGAGDNTIDWVAVQTGRMVGNHVHHANDWCAYVKGGSAYIVIENNWFEDCGTGGFTVGQGTGGEYMVAPWMHYEAYDVKVVNNLVTNVQGAGLGVQGGYNILLAHNTLYKVGDSTYHWGRTQAIDVLQGGQECDHDRDPYLTGFCDKNFLSGAWVPGWNSSDVLPIPNKNVLIFNNIIYNPDGYNTINTLFNVANPNTSIPSNINMPSPSLADDNLVIKGNFIYVHEWPGEEFSLFSHSNGCGPTNTTCNTGLINQYNTINTTPPELVDPESGDFHPVASGNVFSATTYAIPDFNWSNLPTLTAPAPLAYREVPAGTLSNTVPVDRDGNTRSPSNTPGAYLFPTE